LVPKWLQKRFPVAWEEVTAEVFYPDVSLPEKSHYIHIGIGGY